MKIMNLLKWSVIGALMTVFLSIESEPANASIGSAPSDASITQQNNPLKQNRRNHRRHRGHRSWGWGHHGWGHHGWGHHNGWNGHR